MKEKKVLIIESAIKLFASKGFDATSIQEIANECGISKGAFYLYFKSKEALLLAIFEYYYERIQTRIQQIEAENLPPREKFLAQVITNYDEIIQHKEFIIMQAREQAIPFNDSIAEFIQKMRLEASKFFKESLLAIYGERAAPHVWDLTVMLKSIFHSYFEIIVFDKAEIDLNALAQYIINRADNLVEGLAQSGEMPILPPTLVEEKLMGDTFIGKKLNKSELIRKISETKQKLDKSEDLYITLDVLESEIRSDSPRMPVIKGMLANLKNENGTKELEDLINKFFQFK
ncbi:TetR family transcriptional regulator [Bacillus canaveralius]|uniref:TetR family transcriptional regulator n=1 Tax=Bacillus canaveralius TaxID=1403243 RepID=A0A2N5GMY3_9BACI|nr:TetR/AcrR family transcriptional regulator [Bacillus canaveralius]PLR83520.1 TetR family transcriptional regulator [Bacillus canaveralius]PLS00706.1 TetR family transcriptional regulator [Bacillus canaveralius]RSK48598.1 TetR/AcrR family transcriptional regulator [Bacillus canaveralius]